MGFLDNAVEVKALRAALATPRSMAQVATILVKRQSDGYQLWGRRRDTNLYTTPGGKFEDDETPEQAAARELFEEAGIIASPDQLVKLGVREFPERNLTVHCFVIIVHDSVKPSSANDPDREVSVWEWLPTMPIDMHAKPNALEPYARPKFTLSTRKLQTRAPGQVNFTVIQSKVAPTDNNKIFKFIASTNEVDRHGTRLLSHGCQHINFDKNPVFLWNHNKDGLPDDVIGRVLSLEITDSEVIATIEFLTERPDGSRRERAWQCWQDVLAGILKAVSVGFVPLAESPVFKSAEESAKYLAGGGIIDVTQWDLCELSLCPIGSNPDALHVRRLSSKGRFTLSRRDVVDSSGHKHAANGQFGSGGSTKAEDKPKKKLGNAAEKHSAAAQEAKTHEAHSKAGKAHAAVARAALKRGDIDKATSALAQAKLHRDEAKRLKTSSNSTKPEAESSVTYDTVGIDEKKAQQILKKQQTADGRVGQVKKINSDLQSLLGKDHGIHTLLNAFSAPGASPQIHSIITTPTSVQIRLTLHDSKGQQIGHTRREIVKQDGKLIAKQDELFLRTGTTKSSGQGLGSNIIANNFAAYRQIGVAKATVHAAEVGSYVWAKMGYSASPKDLEALNSDFARYLQSKGIKPSKFKSVNEIANFTNNGVKHGKDFLLHVGKEGLSGENEDLGWHGEINVNPNDPGYQTLQKYLRKAKG